MKTILIIFIVFIIVSLIIFIPLLISPKCAFTNLEEQYHFVHISKNGGTSIENTLKDVHNFHFYNHDYTAGDINSDKIYGIIRDPVERFISAFNFAKKGGFSPNAETFPYHPIHGYENANHLLDNLRKNDTKAKKVIYTLQEGIPGTDANVVYWPQIFWLYSNKNKDLILLDFSKLNEVFKNLTGYTLKHTNKTSKEKEKLSQENIDFLKEIYKNDFKLYDLVKKSEGIYKTTTSEIMKLGKPYKLITPSIMYEKYF